MEKPKVIALVMCSEIPPHDSMAAAVKETWGEQSDSDVETMYYWANGKDGNTIPEGSGLLIGKDLILGVEGSRQAILKKTIMAYRWIVKNLEFNYIFRCCSGSYVHKRALYELAAGKPREKVWSGLVFTGNFPNQCIGGGGMLLSRDVVQLIVENEDAITSFGYPGDHDDISVGRFLFDSGIKPDPAPVVDNAESPVPGCHHYHFRDRPDLMKKMHELLTRA